MRLRHLANALGVEGSMLNASHYLANETLPNGLRLQIRATEPHDDLAGAVQRQASPKSFFYRFLRPKHYLTAHEITSLVNCDFVRQVGLVGLVRHNLRMAIVAGARYWITGPDEAEIAFMVADDYQKQGIGTAMLNHLCSIARQAGLKRFYALAIPDNEGAPRLLKKLGFPCDIRSDPAQRMMHITVQLTSTAPTQGSQTIKETGLQSNS
jgi:GNAT superfamily N-acetyltransferase